MRKLVLGIMTAPGVANQMSTKIKKQVEDYLNQAFHNKVQWTIEIKVDQVTGAAESAKQIMNQAVHMKKSSNWNFVISLTDLPIFHQKDVVLADIDRGREVAQISLPALGALPNTKKIPLKYE